jgi:hypothetical protein
MSEKIEKKRLYNGFSFTLKYLGGKNIFIFWVGTKIPLIHNPSSHVSSYIYYMSLLTRS